MIETKDGATMITGEHIALFRLITVISALKLETTTGLQMTRNNMAFKSAQQILTAEGRKPERTKKRVLDQLRQLKIDLYPEMPTAQQTAASRLETVEPDPATLATALAATR